MLNFNELSAGDRIVIRYRLEVAGQFGEQFSDALGTVERISEHSITVLTRTGAVEVQRSTITHAKRVPPAPPRRGKRIDPLQDQP